MAMAKKVGCGYHGDREKENGGKRIGHGDQEKDYGEKDGLGWRSWRQGERAGQQKKAAAGTEITVESPGITLFLNLRRERNDSKTPF
jgi:hypothetical protein